MYVVHLLIWIIKNKRTTFANTPFLRRCSDLLSKVNSKHKRQQIHLVACFLSLDNYLIHNVLSSSSVKMSKLPTTKTTLHSFLYTHIKCKTIALTGLCASNKCLFDISFCNNICVATLCMKTTIKGPCFTDQKKKIIPHQLSTAFCSPLF